MVSGAKKLISELEKLNFTQWVELIDNRLQGKETILPAPGVSIGEGLEDVFISISNRLDKPHKDTVLRALLQIYKNAIIDFKKCDFEQLSAIISLVYYLIIKKYNNSLSSQARKLTKNMIERLPFSEAKLVKKVITQANVIVNEPCPKDNDTGRAEIFYSGLKNGVVQ